MVVQVRGPVEGRARDVLTPDALEFVERLERAFGGRRRELLAKRATRQERFDAGELPDFLPDTADVREGAWKVAPVPADLQDRRVEITGPVERKMIINALNSGARVFMADFEDACSPTWENVVQGQVNLVDAIERTIDHRNPDGKLYRLDDEVATLLVRPRGWHLEERHVHVDGRPASAGLVDLGLYLYHNHARLRARGTGPYFYLPKLESHLEARLWNDVFVEAERVLGLKVGTIKATVLVETILAAFEMEEILHELREHSAGLNAGRWDYLFSIIKKFRNRPDMVLPERAALTMDVPFMRAYCDLLVRTCHRRGAHAMGGMAAFIPSRRDESINALALKRVREDKEREATQGFDGTWVAHPNLVRVAAEVFDRHLGERPNQVDRLREDVRVTAAELLDLRVPGAAVTEAGLRTNVGVGVQYLESWLRGNGAVAIHNLMEDAATAEISRSQVWQWVRHGALLGESPTHTAHERGAGLPDGRPVTRELVRRVLEEEVARLPTDGGRLKEAAELFDHVALAEPYVEFLTIPAYARLDGESR